MNEKTESGLILLYVFLFILSFISFVFFSPTKIAFMKYVSEAKNEITSNGYEAGGAWDKKVYKNDDGTFDISFRVDEYNWSSYSGKVSGGNSSFLESNIHPNYIGIVIGVISLIGGIALVLYIRFFNKNHKKIN